MYCPFFAFLTILIGSCICIPRPNNAELLTESPANQTVNTTEIKHSTDAPTEHSTDAPADSPTNRTAGDKVQLTVYYESNCGASKYFIIGELKPTMIKLSKYMDLQLFPYGNAYTSPIANSTQYKFDCQHGKAECYGNMVHACAIDVLKNITKAVLYNSCLMETSYDYRDEHLQRCASDENVTSETLNEIVHCTNSTHGNALMKSIGDITWEKSTNYVPHLTFDGSSEYESRGSDNLIGTVCDMLYPKPQECLTDD